MGRRPRAPGSRRSRADLGTRQGAVRTARRNTDSREHATTNPPAVSRPQDGLPHGIGTALKDARRRLGMDVKEAEERTKIRAKYLRALEAEDWEVLPAPAYVRGFLRTYGQLLGLDGEMLADEFRRRYEAPATPASVASEPVLQERRRSSGSTPSSRGPLIAVLALGIVVLLIVLGTLGGDDDPPATEDPNPTKRSLRADDEGAGGAGGGNRGGEGRSESVPIELSVEPQDTVTVCLVAGEDEALIDGQTLAAGSVENFADIKNYRLDIASGGVVRLTAGEATERLEADGPASWEADSRGIRGIDYAGPDCP